MKKPLTVLALWLAIGAVAVGDWRNLPNPPAARVDAAAVVDDAGVVYLIGGGDRHAPSAAAYAFDGTGGWRTLTPAPKPLAQSAVACADGKIYAAGGYGAAGVAADLSIYRIADGQWTAGPPLPAATYGGRLTAVAGRLFFCGGADVSDVPQKACWEYDAVNQAWLARAAMGQARKHHAAAAFNGRIYVVGGVGTIGDAPVSLSSVEYYDVPGDAWHAAAALPVAFWGGAAGAARQRLTVCGGLQNGAASANCWAYDDLAAGWAAAPAAPFAAYRTAGGGAGLLVVGGERVQPRGYEIVGAAALWRDGVDDDVSPTDDDDDDDVSPADDDDDDDVSPADDDDDDDVSPADDDDDDDQSPTGDDDDNNVDDDATASPTSRRVNRGCGC